MLEKLLKNTHKGGWQNEDPMIVYNRACDELKELHDSIERWKECKDDLLHTSVEHPKYTEIVGRLEILTQAVAREAADTANFVLMVADIVGGLEED